MKSLLFCFQGSGGMVLVDPLFQRTLVAESRKRGIPVIFDEALLTSSFQLTASCHCRLDVLRCNGLSLQLPCTNCLSLQLSRAAITGCLACITNEATCLVTLHDNTVGA